ncbi:cupin domain-containing protein [Sphingomonas sp. MG17]|uniref:Cupin domain-containing protein n=1 Tax=Sphingomonas tagetis TaxID=2949092 RepID=A0A9X2KKR3_9SPHN|nr:cupin domain-containing protein [Sphingomonas tagetis]MCP3730000.1 cupin domain-containing protein [Sphingomonas tagetis]
MDVVRFADAPFYTAPDHEAVEARRLQGGEASSADFALVGYSTFPASARVPMGAGPIGKVYVVTQGTLTIEQADGERHVLSQWDSIFIAADESRAVVNEGSEPAAMIVVTPPPQH